MIILQFGLVKLLVYKSEINTLEFRVSGATLGWEAKNKYHNVNWKIPSGASRT